MKFKHLTPGLWCVLICISVLLQGCNHRSKKQQEAFDFGRKVGWNVFSEVTKDMSPDDIKLMAVLFYGVGSEEFKERGFGDAEFNDFYEGMMKAYKAK